MVVSLPMPDCHCNWLLFLGFSNVYHSACVWPTALKLGCVTNLDPLFLVMGFISFVDEIQPLYLHKVCSAKKCCTKVKYWYFTSKGKNGR